MNNFLFILLFWSIIIVNAECSLSYEQYRDIKWSKQKSSICSTDKTELKITKGNNVISLHYDAFTKDPAVFEKDKVVIFSEDEQFVEIPTPLHKSGIAPTIVYGVYYIKNDSLEKCMINDAKEIDEVLKEIKFLKN